MHALELPLQTVEPLTVKVTVLPEGGVATRASEAPAVMVAEAGQAVPLQVTEPAPETVEVKA